MAEKSDEYVRKSFIKDNNSFIIYKSWRKEIFSLSESDRLKLFTAIFDYQCDGIIADLEGEVRMALMFIVDQFERDGKKWEDVCERRSAAKRKRDAEKQISDIKQTENTNVTKVTIVTDNEDDIVNENVNDIVNESVNVDDTATHSPPHGQSSYWDFNGDIQFAFGEYENVLLTLKQKNKLIADFGEEKFAEYVQRVDEYVQQHRDEPYNDSNATIRSWIRKDKKKAAAKEQEEKAKREAEGQNASLPPPEELERMLVERATKKDPADGHNIDRAKQKC